MPLTKVNATVLGLVHLLNTCASVWRLRDDVAGRAVTPKNARHRDITANKDMVNSCCATVRCLVREYTRQSIWIGVLITD